MDYTYSSSMDSASSAALGAGLMIYTILMFAIGVFLLVCMWKIFVKAGYEGWKCLIPFYNTYCLFELSWGNGWLMFLGLIPFVNFVVMIATFYKLAKAFGKGVGFTFGLIFLSVVFIPILAFGGAEYEGV